MPVGLPSQRPEPKSAWTGASRPIERIIAAEFGATGSLSTRWFQGFAAGKTGQPAISGGPAVPPPSAATARRAAALERIEYGVPPRRGLEQAEEQVPRCRVGGCDPELRPDQAGDVGEAAARGDRARRLDPVRER